MIVIGAKGFAKQLIEVFYESNDVQNLFFFDDVSINTPDELYGFKILKNKDDAKHIFQKIDRSFCLGIGDSRKRLKLASLFQGLGGELSSVISSKAYLSRHVKFIGDGSTILATAIIENDVYIGSGVLVNSFASIYHDSIVGDFCEIAPGAKILGRAEIGDGCLIGANAVILSDIKVGEGSIIGAGAVVINNVPPNSIFVGVPAKKIGTTIKDKK